jgi:hypothetical protein
MRISAAPGCGRWISPAALGLFAVLAATSPSPSAAASGDPTYAALRALAPDGRRLAIADLKLTRDAFTFDLAHGTLHLLAPVDGRTVGAVFVGDGSFTLAPASANERRHLALLAGDPRLEVLQRSFHRLVLWAADDTFDEIFAGGPPTSGAPDPDAAEALAAARDWARHRFHTNFELRVAEDLINQPGWKTGAFIALVDSDGLPPAAAVVDALGAAHSGLAELPGTEDTGLFVGDDEQGGFWYLSDRRAEVESGRLVPTRSPLRAISYRISTRVERGDDLAGETVISLQTLLPGVRCIRLNLLSKLRLQRAEAAVVTGGVEGAWESAAIVQERALEDSDAAVVLTTAPPKGAEVHLRLAYAGDGVLTDVGENNYVVDARTSWYPNLGIFGEPTPFELEFRVPAGNEVVAIGQPVENRSEGKSTYSRWSASAPVRVAGFNYGKFKRLERHDETTGWTLQVFTNPGRPAILREIDNALRSVQLAQTTSGEITDLDNPNPLDFNVAPPPSVGHVDTATLAESALTDGINAARVYHRYFGSIATNRVAITQQSQWSFGQSWPSLVFLPYLSFLSGTVRATIGLQGIRSATLEGLSYHELAHQWWGHQVGWKSYRDQWLSEGFADFSAALVLQLVNGLPAYDQFWKDERKELLAAPASNHPPHYAVGPISLGPRLATFRDPAAYGAVVYAKGAFVLHMLRMMMRDPHSTEPDGRFIDMMRDFVSTFGGKNASTADFQRVVERHMTPDLNATGDGKMDWFFRQWVEGTEMPRYEATLAIDREADGYRIHGSLAQRDVGADFRALIPIYVEFERGQIVRLALVPMVGESTRSIDAKGVQLPQKPRRALINAHYDVLARE